MSIANPEPREARCYISERIVRTVVIEFFCPHCWRLNEYGDDIGNYPKCRNCGERVVLRNRFPSKVRR
jgi:DNA-directed RNA polymerase subunit RPC12/RpoP